LPGEPVAAGESVAVQGTCLTVVAPKPDGFTADLSRETLSRTTLGALKTGARVNLERSLRLDSRIGGHLVLGHVDATTTVTAVRAAERFASVRLALPFEVELVPTTLAATTLGTLRPGDRVNVETDVLAKYVRRALGGQRRDLTSLLADFSDATD
jgi:riboflavin synthase